MKILAHRGYWNEEIPSNSENALKTALEKGYGFESDLRDYMGELVISHDIASRESIKADCIFQLLNEYNDRYLFAINIKADGLKDQLIDLLNRYSIDNYFTFDMSVPQMIEYKEKGIRFFTRQSEYEKECVLYEDADGVWIDGFESNDWINEELVNYHQDNGKIVCIVSPDLHKRSYEQFWGRLKQMSVQFDKIYLCTDFPDEAKCFFDGL